RRGNLTKAQEFYKQYLSVGGNNANSVMDSVVAIAEIDKKKGKKAEADAGCRKVIATHKRLATKENPVGASAAAECKYNMVYKTFEDLRAVRIPSNPAKQQAAVQDKLRMLNKLKEQLKEVIAYDDGPTVVNSLALIGQAYQHMAAAIYAVPVPKGLDAEGLKQYKAGVDNIARPFQEKAVENYLSALESGRKLEGSNEWMKVAHKELSILNPQQYSDGGEKVILTKVPDGLGY